MNPTIQTALRSFSITLTSASYGCRLVYRKGRRDASLRYRQLTSPEAIAFYETCWYGFLGLMVVLSLACFWLGYEVRGLVNRLIDPIVEEALQPAPIEIENVQEVDQLATSESQAIAPQPEVTPTAIAPLPPAEIEPTGEPVASPKRKRGRTRKAA